MTCWQGSLPPQWGAPEAFPALRYLDMTGNFFLTGPLPNFSSSSGGMQRLEVLMAAACSLSGTLPDAWPQDLPALGALDFSMNNITGQPPTACMHGWPPLLRSRTMLCLCPSRGMMGEAWPAGTLPAEWQGMGSMQTLSIVGNSLEGTLPPQ